MPLRDTEGAFARAQSAMVAFGSEGATATDKISAGFLLAGDSIASFVSGGAIGLAIAAGVAGIALLADTIGEEAEETKKAEEATKDYADALDALAKSAAAANITVSLQRAKEREKEVRERVRFIDEERRDVKRQFDELQDQHFEHIEELKGLQNANPLTGRGARKRQLEAQKEADSAELKVLKAKFKKLDSEYSFSHAKISKANQDVASETAANQEHEITKLIAFLDKATKATTKAVEKETKKRSVAVETFAQVMSRAAKSDKERTEAQQALRKEDEDFDKRLAKEKAERAKAARLRFVEDNKLFAEGVMAREDAEKEAAKTAESLQAKRVADFKKAHSVELAGVNAMISGLETMAHEGTLSLEALADATITAAGKELTAKGTVHLMAGLANMAATFGAHGGPEAAQGAAMIAAGIGMGAIGGAIGRSGAAPSSSQSTPTDTRNTRAAATSSSAGDGGPVVINFNGPAYDRAGVSQIINSGMRRARHRRLAGA